ncbi:uncharacterized protein JN550_004362 [Neoarthrinium moseri]|uniref:uncharacterized protein n=1 Tax=Neoarthrinium moseri TaxID=1658444 RepID=UPI001FDC1091|nr:uncharacterized protein JN550_004362 [Neoarthrinium moseri]KAI1871368.1 hypothetical protein JN550_004362 [Neoarthrinium moseri]
MEPESAEPVDIRAQVLQSTLNEVATRHEGGKADSTTAECCVICLEAVSEACEAKPCRHNNFDFICLVSWLEQQSKCPLCKAVVSEVCYEVGESDETSWKTFVVPEKREPAAPSTPRRPLPPRRNWPYYRPHRRRHYEASAQPPTEDEEVSRRRDVYRNQTYSLHVGSNRMSQYRDLTPQLFEHDAALVSRARMWLRRELKVFEFLHTPSGTGDDELARRRANNAEFLLEYIIAILKTVDIQGSQGQAEDMLQEFLGRENTRLLMHELKSFLRSPYTSLRDWDRAVQYDRSKKRRIDDDEDAAPSSSRSSPRPSDASGRPRIRGDSYRPVYSDSDRR